MTDAIVWVIDYRRVTFGPTRGTEYVAAETKQGALCEWDELQEKIDGEILETISVEPYRNA